MCSSDLERSSVAVQNLLDKNQPSFSVFAFGESTKVSIEGAKWPLAEKQLKLSTLGARNIAVTDAKVTNHHNVPGLLVALDFNTS